MKKGILVLALAGLSVLMFSSCSSASYKQFVLDDSVPAEQLTMIEIHNLGKIVTYNGITVDLDVKQDWDLLYYVKVPAGDTLFEINLNYVVQGEKWKGESLLFRYNFLPDKKYSLRFGVLKAKFEGIYGLNVYTYEMGEKIPIDVKTNDDPNFTAFVPFLNAPGSEKTVLE
jgi:hypothetical protein